jgi:hypothetical protein
MGPRLLHNLIAPEQMSQFMSFSEAVASLVAVGDVLFRVAVLRKLSQRNET